MFLLTIIYRSIYGFITCKEECLICHKFYHIEEIDIESCDFCYCSMECRVKADRLHKRLDELGYDKDY